MVQIKPVHLTSFKEFCKNNSFFKLGTYTKNFGVLPTVFLSIADCFWMAFCTIKGFQRTDVVLSKNWIKSKNQNELTDLLIHPVNRKFLTFYQNFEPQQDLYDTYEAMKRAESSDPQSQCK